MNEAAKAQIAVRLTTVEAGTEVDFDFGTKIGEAAAKQACIDFLFDDPESVTPRASLEA